jgi:hypothetical protein
MRWSAACSLRENRRMVGAASGSLTRVIRHEGPAVWQFRWSEKGHDGKRIYRKRILGSADQYESREAAYLSVKCLISEINSGKGIAKPTTLTMGQLCDHFQQREMTQEGSWRTSATMNTSKVTCESGLGRDGRSMLGRCEGH